jgi:hypothetical protein
VSSQSAVGYLKVRVALMDEKTKIIMKDKKRRIETITRTTIALWNLWRVVKRLFSQIMSVGSEAS